MAFVCHIREKKGGKIVFTCSLEKFQCSLCFLYMLVLGGYVSSPEFHWILATFWNNFQMLRRNASVTTLILQDLFLFKAETIWKLPWENTCICVSTHSCILSMMAHPGQAQTSALTALDQTSQSDHHRRSWSARLMATVELISKMWRNRDLNMISHKLGVIPITLGCWLFLERKRNKVLQCAS